MQEPEPRAANVDFFRKANEALKDLFDRARQANELHFAFALMPEFKGMMEANWNTAREAEIAFEQFLDLIDAIPVNDQVRVRVALSFYLHLAEGAGYYEVPKKMMLILDGKGNNTLPFAELVDTHRITGEAIAPNANRIFKDLIGHAQSLGLTDLAHSFRDAFDGDVRNATAHADYVVAGDGLHLAKRNGGQLRNVPWGEFTDLMDRAINFFQEIRDIRKSHIASYYPPRVVRGQLMHEAPTDWVIYCNPHTRHFCFTSGPLSKVMGQIEESARRV